MRQADSDWIIKFEDLNLIQNNEVILEKIDFSIDRGGIHLILGPNGAGKSSLIKCILGKTEFSGKITTRLNQNRPIGYVPQLAQFHSGLPLTVAEFLSICWWKSPAFIRIDKEKRKHVSDILDRIGSSNLIDKQMKSLSGGEARRIFFCQAIWPLPELLILDEPTNHIDEITSVALIELCKKFSDDGLTIVIVTHDLASFLDFSNMISLINKSLLFTGTIAEFYEYRAEKNLTINKRLHDASENLNSWI